MRSLQHMVEEEAYCVEILTQIASIVSASEKVALILLEDHVEHCVREAIEDGETVDEKVAELTPRRGAVPEGLSGGRSSPAMSPVWTDRKEESHQSMITTLILQLQANCLRH